jgi:hypothetical protein
MTSHNFQSDSETILITQIALTIFALDYILDFN